jgi:hypothetical protein
MTRDQLKKIIKECLIELLAEGMGSNLSEQVQRPVMPRAPGQPNRAPAGPSRRPSALDHMKYSQPSRPAPAMNEHIRQVTSDPILAAIMADTAQTTLLQQTEGRGAPPSVAGGRAEQVVASYAPDELIGSITGQSADQMNARWSQAAFAPVRHLPGMGSMSHIVNDYDPYSGK